MSFMSRMTTETGTPMPRWLYLLLKPVETLAIGVALANLTGMDQLTGTAVAAALYVGIGLWAWYRHRLIALDLQQGSFLGDLVYHGVLSLIALAIVAPVDPLVRGALVGGLAGLWWALDVNNYGPMRNPNAP